MWALKTATANNGCCVILNKNITHSYKKHVTCNKSTVMHICSLPKPLDDAHSTCTEMLRVNLAIYLWLVHSSRLYILQKQSTLTAVRKSKQ